MVNISCIIIVIVLYVYRNDLIWYLFFRCPWSEFIDPVFEVLSERYTAVRFLLVDADKCKV